MMSTRRRAQYMLAMPDSKSPVCHSTVEPAGITVWIKNLPELPTIGVLTR
jgi:hypothetical protein